MMEKRHNSKNVYAFLEIFLYIDIINYLSLYIILVPSDMNYHFKPWWKSKFIGKWNLQ